MGTFILIMAIATSDIGRSGATSIQQEFSSREKCAAAGASFAASIRQHGNYVLAWDCFPK